MKYRYGFDIECAKAAMAAMKTDDPTFLSRASENEFYGLYDGSDPVGAVIFEGNVIHVASLKVCGLCVLKLVRKALSTREILFAPIEITNKRACRLAEGFGFKVGIVSCGINLYWRLP